MLEPLLAEIKEKNLEEAFRSQPGNLSFDYYIPFSTKDQLVLVDSWVDTAAFDAHMVCPVIDIWKSIGPKYVESRTLDRYDV
jgi:quinol monooxygenase YgiN